MVDKNFLNNFVNKYLIFDGRCRRHCDKPTSFIQLQSNIENFIAAYICPSNFVSRVIYFSLTPDFELFREFLSLKISSEIVEIQDIRLATRHGWELGKDALKELRDVSPNRSIREIYWTPHFKADERRGVFLCSDPQRGKGCGKFFVQDLESKKILCPKCR